MGDAERVVAFIRANPDFELIYAMEGWGHMGATLTDAILQAGIDYKSVVLPRAKKVHDNYPDAKTTSGFAAVLARECASKVLNWSGDKLNRLAALVNLLLENGIETEDQLRMWLASPENLNQVRQIKGIKDKTTDYLQILVGIQAVAVDRHLFGFLARAGIVTNDYGRANTILKEAAALLGVEPALFDHSIWKYMSGDSEMTACASAASS